MPGHIDPFSTATEMLQALRTRQLSAQDLLDLHLERIERYNPELNAIVTPSFEQARQSAVAADGERAHGKDRPLLGLPLTIKDCIYVAGLPTTGGVPERAKAISEADAPIAARIRAAGGVLLSKTNVPPYAADWQSVNPLFGRSNNPWDQSRTPGGSTGGGAAALAAGLTPLEFGSDFAGSIRIPAAFCGVFGHKPSETVVPGSGHFPGPNTPNTFTVRTVQGPLARSAEDLELALDVISGPEAAENTAWRLELPAARHGRLANFRIALLPSITWLPVDAEIVATLESLATELSRLGATVRRAAPDDLSDLRDYCALYHSINSVLANVGRPEADRHEEAQHTRQHSDAPHDLAWADGLVASASDYVIWVRARDRYRAAFRAFFGQWDVLLAPVNIVNAFPHTDAPWHERRLDVNGEAVDYRLQSALASLCNLSGHPGTAFPAGQTRSGLPIGLQAIGPYLEDRTPIRFAALVARELGGFRRPPGYE